MELQETPHVSLFGDLPESPSQSLSFQRFLNIRLVFLLELNSRGIETTGVILHVKILMKLLVKILQLP
jgi:hypothetical protein